MTISPTDCATVRIDVDPLSRAWLVEIECCLFALGKIVPRPVEIVELVDRLTDARGAWFVRKAPAAGNTGQRVIGFMLIRFEHATPTG